MPSATGWSANSPLGQGALSRGSQPLDDPVGMRCAGHELLSLALIDARNGLLALLALDESAAALRLAAHAGWYQEYWIARHVQRQRGEACDPQAPRLAGIEPRIDSWLATPGALPTPDAVRAYLAETLEVTLDLLASAAQMAPGRGDDDAALHFYRQSLLHEDRLTESLATRLQLGAPSARAERDALWLPAQCWQLGAARVGAAAAGQGGGLVPHNERWAHAVAVPEFEIDAQPVSWQRYVEFAGDGGYDRRALWDDAGWAWVQHAGRRAPRHVEQLQGGVLVQRGNGAAVALQRAPAAQPVMHVSRHEAAAWCRWAGRRLPTEPEWELCASRAASRGFVWGDVFEWVAGSARAYPDAGPAAPGALDPIPPPGTQGVLRGASFATRSRWRHPQARRFAPPGCDTMFCGFRSCAV